MSVGSVIVTLSLLISTHFLPIIVTEQTHKFQIGIVTVSIKPGVNRHSAAAINFIF
jgi:hypothetical protein